MGVVIDSDGRPVDFGKLYCLQSRALQDRTLEHLEVFKGEIEELEGCTFKTQKLPTGRVLVLLDNDEPPLVAYLSDHSADASVVLDDFTPEIWPEWLEETKVALESGAT